MVLLAAKLAAEVAERIGVPAVLGEILAGILIGPSLLGWVEPSDVLFMLGELGVILLLLQVGMEMDLGELGKVGRASLLVAVIGVAAPFAPGAAAGLALGQDTKTAIFLGAALDRHQRRHHRSRVRRPQGARRRPSPASCSAPQ